MFADMHSDAAIIFRIRLSRTIVYFLNEINVSSNKLNELIKFNSIRFETVTLVRFLLKADLIYFLSPSIYYYVDKFRHWLIRRIK